MLINLIFYRLLSTFEKEVLKIAQVIGGIMSKKKGLQGYLFVFPGVFLIFLFSFPMMAYALYISFFKVNFLAHTMEWIGLRNYLKAFKEPLFLVALKNTFYYVVVTVSALTVISFIFALIVNRVNMGTSLFKTIYFLPSITPMVVLSLIWLWLYEPNGLFNVILGIFNLPSVNWLMDSKTALPAIIVLSIWAGIGYYMIIFLAGITDIPKSLYESAKLDGAREFQCLVYITIPLLKNTIIFVVVMLIISSFQMFTQVFVMTGGGPGSATEVIATLVYKNAFKYFNMSYAAALAWLLFLIIFIFSFTYLKLFKSEAF